MSLFSLREFCGEGRNERRMDVVFKMLSWSPYAPGRNVLNDWIQSGFWQRSSATMYWFSILLIFNQNPPSFCRETQFWRFSQMLHEKQFFLASLLVAERMRKYTKHNRKKCTCLVGAPLPVWNCEFRENKYKQETLRVCYFVEPKL